MKDTGFSRGKVSEILTELSQSGTVRIIKKSRDRKKYFSLNIPISNLILAKYNRLQTGYHRIFSIVETEFLAKLSEAKLSNPSIDYLKKLFSELISVYSVAQGQMEFLIKFLSNKSI